MRRPMPEPKANSSNKRKTASKKPANKSEAKNSDVKQVTKKPTSKTTPKTTPKTTTKNTRETKSKLKISAEERKRFPHSMFPVKVMHMEGKELTDLKICYFTDEIYANKYIVRSKLKKDEYLMLTKQK